MEETVKGSLFIISAPSGAGKTSLVKALAESLQDVVLSVSYTTRAKREEEKEGVDYHFVTQDEFIALLEKDAFLEHARLFDNFYGTSSLWVEQTRLKGLDVILEIDWQGARQIREQFPDAQSIFILPPSLDALLDRLRRRHSDSETVIRERMSGAKEQISHYNEYDSLICNDQFEEALEDLKAIVRSNRLHWRRQHIQQEELLKKLLS